MSQRMFRRVRDGATAAILVLAAASVLAVATPYVAQDEPVDEAVRLIGQLATDERHGYVLIEREGGDRIPLKGAVDLSEHVGKEVIVTGAWAEDPDGKYFEVHEVEPAG